MDVKQLVKLAGLTHEACGWTGTGMFEMEPNNEETGSLHLYIDIHRSTLEDKDRLEALQKIKENVYAIWGNIQKGIEFWPSDTSETGLYLSVCLDKGTPEK